ncbi:MAG TPA: helix-turn-helix transcriptional regulator, partial [Anaerolineae bacterium]|nr:helix-turn-helix transcriptional regulator [Anaerolineae bacterium]
MTELEEAIARRVIRARERAGLDRAEVASALSLEVNSYGHYERGRTAFSVEQLFIISRFFPVPIEEL